MRKINLAFDFGLPVLACLGILVFTNQVMAADGKEIFEKKCAKCHGMDGNGKGRAGRGLKVDPTAFNDKGIMSKLTDEEMYDASKLGGGDEFTKKHPDYKSPTSGKTLSKEMEAFPNLSDEELKAVDVYIRTFAK